MLGAQKMKVLLNKDFAFNLKLCF